MKKGWIIAGLAVLGAGLATWHFSKQIRLLKQTCFSFGGYKILALTKDSVKIQIKLNLKNLSSLAFVLKAYKFNVFVNNKLVATTISNTPQTIEYNAISPIVIDIDIVPKDVLDIKALSNLLLNANNAIIKIQGSVSVNAAGIPASNVPVLIESKLRDMIPAPGATSQPCV
jgi:hypothetical protein